MIENPYFQEWQQQFQENQARAHMRHDVAAGILEAQFINGVIAREVDEHRAHVAYVNSLPPEAAAAHHAKAQLSIFFGVGLLALGIALFLLFPMTWFATAGFVLGFIGVSNIIWAGR